MTRFVALCLRRVVQKKDERITALQQQLDATTAKLERTNSMLSEQWNELIG